MGHNIAGDIALATKLVILWTGISVYTPIPVKIRTDVYCFNVMSKYGCIIFSPNFYSINRNGGIDGNTRPQNYELRSECNILRNIVPHIALGTVLKS